MISIVVPVYNNVKRLARCVDSILAQTVGDLEIILVDDGSLDGSGKMCDDYKGRDIRVSVIHKSNGGVSEARNSGILASSGEYILFVDSDDYMEAHMCGCLLNVMEREKPDMVICGYHHWYLGRDVQKSPDITGTYLIERFGGPFLRLYESGYLNMPWNKLIRRSKLGAFDAGLSLGEDLLFNLKVLQQSQKVSVIPDCLYHYFQENNGNTLSSVKRDDKAGIAKRVCEETKRIYRQIYGASSDVRRVDVRYVTEILDDVEALAFDSQISGRERLKAIGDYMQDAYFIEININLKLRKADYRILNFFMKLRARYVIFLLIWFRKFLVLLVRKRNRLKG